MTSKESTSTVTNRESSEKYENASSSSSDRLKTLDKRDIASPIKKYSEVGPPYYHVQTIEEPHGNTVYSCKNCRYVSNQDLFATCGDNQVTIYSCTRQHTEPVKVFRDDDKDEEFYAIEWAMVTIPEVNAKIFLLFSGKKGVIRIIDPYTGALQCNLVGHGDSVNDLATHPQVHSIIASASKDMTVRLWNCLNPQALAIFGGLAGHRDQVLTVGFHSSGNYLVSGSMDHTLRVWHHITDEEIKKRIESARKLGKVDTTLAPVEIHFSDAESRDLHMNYVDCAQFLGAFILSKASENAITLSKFGEFEDASPCGIGLRHKKAETLSQIVAKLNVPHTDMWFIKFGLITGPPGKAWIACGNQSKTVHFWDLHDRPLPEHSKYQLKDPRFPSTIRKVEFNQEGSIMFLVGDGGRVSRCDRRKLRSGKVVQSSEIFKRLQVQMDKDSDDNTDTPASSIRDSSTESEIAH